MQMRPFLYSTAPRPLDVLRPGFASCWRESSSVWSVRWAKPIIALSGVRISWLMFARKSLFALVASSANDLIHPEQSAVKGLPGLPRVCR